MYPQELLTDSEKIKPMKIKINIKLTSVINVLLFFILIMGCEQNNLITLPTVKTTGISYLSETSVFTGGFVSGNGGSTVTQRGICWSADTIPSIADNLTTDSLGKGSFISNIKGLSPNKIYHLRAYASNIAGTSYGKEIIFRTLLPDSVSDIDGNVYHMAKIGDQVWMTENLKVTRYNDGIQIPEIKDKSVWKNMSGPAYCWYNNDPVYKNNYGALYNGFTVMRKNLCPVGWHVPSNDEWNTLDEQTGENRGPGYKLKTASANFWDDSNIDITNRYGFSAFPAGFRDLSGYFGGSRYDTFWWTSDCHEPYNNDLIVDDKELVSQESELRESSGEVNYGYSVRCVRDN